MIPKTVGSARLMIAQLRRELATADDNSLVEIERLAQTVKWCFWSAGDIREGALDIALTARRRLGWRR
jgi:hypothetical protein